MARINPTTSLFLLGLAACAGTLGSPEPETRFAVAFRSATPAVAGDAAAGLVDQGVTSVQIDVQSIQAHVDDQWVTLTDEPRSIELMVLQDGPSEALDAALVPPGHYTQVRLVLADDSAIVIDDEAWPLRIPSGSESGLSIPLDADVQPGRSYELTLAFDLDRNLVLEHRGWMLKPVLHVESFDEIPEPADLTVR